MSHIEELVRELNSTSLDFKEGQQRDEEKTLKTIEDSQEEGKPLKFVVTKEEICTTIADTEERNAEGKDQHYDEMLAKFDEEIKLLEELLRNYKDEDEIAGSDVKHSQLLDSEWVSLTSVETGNCFNSQKKGEVRIKRQLQDVE